MREDYAVHEEWTRPFIRIESAKSAMDQYVQDQGMEEPKDGKR